MRIISIVLILLLAGLACETDSTTPEPPPEVMVWAVDVEAGPLDHFDAGQMTLVFTGAVLLDVEGGTVGGCVVWPEMVHELAPGEYLILLNVPGVDGANCTESSVLCTLTFDQQPSDILLSDVFLNNNYGAEIEQAMWLTEGVSKGLPSGVDKEIDYNIL